MNPLLLGGFGVRIKVARIRELSELWVMDGKRSDNIGRMFRFRPRQCPYTSIVIDGHSGYVSLQALHWLSNNKVPLFVMNYDGTLISSVLPPSVTQAHLRGAQFQAAADSTRKFEIAHALVQAKINRSLEVLEWLTEAYDIEKEAEITKREAARLPKAKNTVELRSVEARVALRYWEAYRQCLPEGLRFKGRLADGTNANASDAVNLCLNYGFGFLQGEVRMTINTIGLESAVGFLHDSAEYQTKESLVFDLMEPYRFLIDLVVLQAFGTGKLNLDSFYFSEADYRLRFNLTAKGDFLTLLRERFNSGVTYKGRRMKWDVVIEEKVNELARYLIGARPEVDFNEPELALERTDNKAVREAILHLTQSQAEKLGIGKSTLHYLRKRVKEKKSFRLYGKVLDKLQSMT